ncbi:dihydrodipicolinate synthase family protein [Actinocorallia sp. A-T 12471]|uniref:dihydrodipicolinate synthase family protein n=1 Tax=Actinocorallia sp. A-T 12471 TaxID=3089813 RepID=UPI0029CFD8D7|nr:dihydrodipicolinate synthase family protein [Actinocorallia sp. A-T 12471]MDX6741182.1 dihydrodipicolinate synthase family protein [Actinocorallia sp. A-T 12471]
MSASPTYAPEVPKTRPGALPAGSYAMGITPFDRDGRLDEGALRDHVGRLAAEGVGFWPASPATGEGSTMDDAEILRALEIVAEETAGHRPVVAGSREFPTAGHNIAFAAKAHDHGADAVQIYPPTLGHSFAPTEAMFTRFYDEVLSAVATPVVLSSNFMTGFEVPASVFERPVEDFPQVIGIFKHHPDQHNVAEFVARFAPRTTVLTMTQKLMFSFAAGATAELDNLQNVAPRLCRALHDELARGDAAAAGETCRAITRVWGGISRFSAAHSAPRVVVYKAMLRLLGLPGGHPRKPYLDLEGDALKELARMIDAVGLRELEGLA